MIARQFIMQTGCNRGVVTGKLICTAWVKEITLEVKIGSIEKGNERIVYIIPNSGEYTQYVVAEVICNCALMKFETAIIL
jgi:hypothetical protein